MISMKKVLRVRMIFIKRSYKFFERFLWTRNKYLVFEWTSSQWTRNKYFVFEWTSSQRKITNSLENFWQRETSSSNDFVIALDCASNVIVDEYNNIDNARIFQSCWKVRWQKIEEWTRMKSRLLIDRLSEACQNRSLLETFAQSICTYFCT